MVFNMQCAERVLPENLCNTKGMDALDPCVKEKGGISSYGGVKEVSAFYSN